MIYRVIILFSLLACASKQKAPTTKINGLCLVAPPFEIKSEYYEPIVDIGANWVAVIPYAFCSPKRPTVTFDHPNQWHGEKTAGVIHAVNLAKAKGLKVMIKPHLWVLGQGWAGDLKYESEEDLEQWMDSYTRYLLHFAEVAEELQVDLISIGTEVRHIAREYPDFWFDLIDQIKTVYHGKVTYSANWDNYENIKFWSKLDYIGVDAYFPSDTSKVPGVKKLVLMNQPIKDKLKKFSALYLKKVLFTEFGYQSVDFCTAGHWKNDDKNHNINQISQANAYEALFETYWKQEWFAGGFAWKWHYKHHSAGGKENSEFTPQNKLAEKILKSRYTEAAEK